MSKRWLWGCSVTSARTTNGMYSAIIAAIEKMRVASLHHMAYFAPNNGRDNERRLIGKFDTPSLTSFSYDVGARNTSIRIPRHVAEDRCGYFEERRFVMQRLARARFLARITRGVSAHRMLPIGARARFIIAYVC